MGELKPTYCPDSAAEQWEKWQVFTTCHFSLVHTEIRQRSENSVIHNFDSLKILQQIAPADEIAAESRIELQRELIRNSAWRSTISPSETKIIAYDIIQYIWRYARLCNLATFKETLR